jgi:GNAT superfamily N-acetyltransferase
VYRIRQAIPADLAHLAGVERAAARLFPPSRIPDPDAVTPLDELEEARSDALLFVADLDGAPIGFGTCSISDGRLHLDELAVHPDHGRRGLGRRLVETVIEAARDRGLAGVSLTTFADLPWNAPFYESLGFRVLAEAELDRFLAETLAGERRRGLTERVAMLFALANRP